MHQRQDEALRLPVDRETYERIAEYAKANRMHPDEALSELLDLGLRIASLRSQYAGTAMEGDESALKYGNETLPGSEPQRDASTVSAEPEKNEIDTRPHSPDPPTRKES
jgi:hypothetical protein